MAEDPDNIAFVQLRRIDDKVDRLSDEGRDPKVRVTRLGGIHHPLERVERRFDLHDGPDPKAAE